MHFLSTLVTALAAIVSLVAAQTGPNYFTYPVGTDQLTAGQTATLKWVPTTGGTVTLVLRSGASNDLIQGMTIAFGVANSGSYSWAVPASITRGSDYTIEIISNQDSTAVNYTPQIVIQSDNTIASVTNAMSSATMPMTSSMASSAMTSSATGSSTTAMSSTGSMTTSGMMTSTSNTVLVETSVPDAAAMLSVQRVGVMLALVGGVFAAL